MPVLVYSLSLWAGHMECVKVLLDKGADINMQDEVSVYDIMGHEGALYVSSSGAFLVVVECVVELCVWPCVLSITLMSSCVLGIGGTCTLTMICTCHLRKDGPH